MPSLAEQIKKNSKALSRGPGGQLLGESQEGLQSLTAKAGLQAPPTTPLGQSLLGASADQQKMAGTPAQKTKALSLATDPEDTLSGAVRRDQVRSVATQSEQVQQQKSQEMQDLGGLGDRVHAFVEAQRAKLANQTGAVAVAAKQDSGVAGAEGAVDLENLLGQLQADPANMQLQLQVNQALGRDLNSVLSPDEINQLYEDTTESIGQGAEAVVDDNLTVGNLFQDPAFGYTPTELSDLLELPEAQIASMTVPQLRDRIAQISDQQFSSTAQNEQMAGSLNLGAAERGLARQAARESSRVGTRSSEADIASLEQQIASADAVQFGGKTYSVEDLLADDTLSGVITDYLNAPEGSETRQRIDASEPELKAFIERNKALLEDAAERLTAGATEFGAVQNDNSGLISGTPISPEIAKDMIPGFGSLAAERIDEATVPILGVFKNPDVPNGEKVALTNSLNTLRDIDPTLLKEMGTMNYDELKALGAIDNTAKWQNYVQTKNEEKALRLNPPKDLNEAYQYLFGSPVDPAAVQEMLKRASFFSSSGQGLNNEQYRFQMIVDQNQDGVPDAPDVIANRLKQVLGAPQGPRDALARNFTPLQGTGQGMQGINGFRDSLYEKIGHGYKDGQLTYDFLKGPTAATLTIEEMQQLAKSKMKMAPGVKSTVEKSLSQMINNEAASPYNVKAGTLNLAASIMNGSMHANELNDEQLTQLYKQAYSAKPKSNNPAVLEKNAWFAKALSTLMEGRKLPMMHGKY